MKKSDLPENVRKRGEDSPEHALVCVACGQPVRPTVAGVGGVPVTPGHVEPARDVTCGAWGFKRKGPKYPGVVVQLVGEDGNVFAILGRVKRALRDSGVGAEEITKFFDEATTGDYNHVLATVQRWVTAR